jgi:predicted enzyme related to lactoylglutathione lyase
MGAPVVHFEVTTGGDPGELQRFYADTFDWSVDAGNAMRYGVVVTGPEGEGINGGISASADGGNHVTFYVQVPDIDAALATVEAGGGTTVQPRMVVPGMVTLAIFADPHGNLVGLVEPDVPPAG